MPRPLFWNTTNFVAYVWQMYTRLYCTFGYGLSGYSLQAHILYKLETFFFFFFLMYTRLYKLETSLEAKLNWDFYMDY